MNDNQRAKHFASQLNKTLQESGLKTAEAAKKIGITYKTLYSWRRGKIVPTLSSLKKLASAFNKSVSWFLGRN
ncbi:helix-turn-helix transcriptional regulator [Oenococcus sp.]|uniref:helix-turn-helix transcriptional regulator n=1 Tax=Oenococcus sp. TaxID=1979414 RepID=UPI0039EB1321